jgi:TolA-binding protein
MKAKLSAITSLIVCILCCLGLWLAEVEFSIEAPMIAKVEELSRELKNEKMLAQLTRAGFEDFKQEVAMEIPQAKNAADPEHLRDIASVIPHLRSEHSMDESLSRQNLKIALEFHVEKKFEEATKMLLQIVTEYPESTAALEANYYLVKNFYLTSNKQEALVWSDKMLKQFPDSLWTAKALLVTADIYREQDRKADAIQVYQTIINTFDSPEIKEDIKSRMADLGG